MSRVLFVAGWGRSGSTLMGQLLGNVPGLVSVGELRFIWARGVIGNELCSCRNNFHDCPFWQRVGQRIGGWSTSVANEMIASEKRYQRIHTLATLTSASARSRKAELNWSLRVTSALFSAIEAESGGRMVVDTSKDAPYSAALEGVPDLTIFRLHLVRDSRATAYSWRRTKLRPEITSQRAYMPILSARRAAEEYVVANCAHEYVLRRTLHPWLRIRYEDFTAAPQDTIAEVVRKAVSPSVETKPLNGGSPASVSHEISGNPVRFAEGGIRVVADEVWKTETSTHDWFVVTTLTLPLLKRYGYRLGDGLFSGGNSRI